MAASLFRRLASPLAAAASSLRARAPRARLERLEAELGSLRDEAGARSRDAQEARSRTHELEAILDAMAETVVALDTRSRIRLANPSARLLFGPESACSDLRLEGRDFLEATRSTELQAVVEACLRTRAEERFELALYRGRERWFQALAAPLFAPSAESGADCPPDSAPGAVPRTKEGGGSGARTLAGVVLVLNDITELRRLERVRRDFVANVSHELRTPIQLIKGFAEAIREEEAAAPAGPTAREAAAEGTAREAAAGGRKRFLEIIERNADRMESLIQDLLILARLEQEGSAWLALEDTEVRTVLAEACEAVAAKAAAKSIALDIACPEGLRARANAGLLEQAVLNLVDNAVKYSPQGSRIGLTAEVEGEGSEARLSLAVRDRGPGIPAKDLPRLFERFYRVDKARSRELGGTGLGLAIVRHIALAHGGTASVESWEGEGSLFTIRIPFTAASGTT